jgi:hypothetical protein
MDRNDQIAAAVNKLLTERGTLVTRVSTRKRTETRLTLELGCLILRRDRTQYSGYGNRPCDSFLVLAPSEDGRTQHSRVFRQRFDQIEVCKPDDWQEAVLNGTPLVAASKPAAPAAAPRMINSVFALGGS